MRIYSSNKKVFLKHTNWLHFSDERIFLLSEDSFCFDIYLMKINRNKRENLSRRLHLYAEIVLQKIFICLNKIYGYFP